MTARSSTSTIDETVTTDALTTESGGTGTGQQHPLAEAGQEATQSVGVLAERATNLGFQQADRAKTQAADGLEQITESIRRVSMDLETEQPQIASVVTTAADQAERIAEYLRTTDARQILNTVEDVARRQPLIFLGGAFVLGLAASRFIKAAGGPSGGTGYGLQGGYQQSGYGQDWTRAGYEATGPGGMGTNGMTGDDRIGEGI
jgi:hypothetical protein